MSAGTPGGPPRGLRGALGDLGGSLLGLLHTRLELASVEFAEAREHTLVRVVVLATAAVCFAFALLMGSLLIVVVLWDTHRVEALLGVTLAYAAIGLVALWHLRRLRREVARPFAASLAELERDRAWLAGRFGDEP